jgi:hypothetical protein
LATIRTGLANTPKAKPSTRLLEERYSDLLYTRLAKPRPYLAFNNLRLYVNGIIGEWNRINELSERIFNFQFATLNMNSDEGRLFRRLQEERELEVHLYLTCWENARKHFADFLKKDGDLALEKIWKQVRPLLESVRQARHFFEHMDERELQGRGYGISSDGRFQISYFERSARPFSNKWVNLGLSEIRLLTKAFEKLIASIQARPDVPEVDTTLRLQPS